MGGMVKRMCLIRGIKDETHDQFRERILELLKRTAGDASITDLRVVLTVESPPKVSVIPFRKQKIASISVKSPGMPGIEPLIQEPGFAGVYDVDEAIPVGYEKTWNDMEPTPGVNLLTLFRKKKSIDQKTFLKRWHQGHTPLSLKIHPLWNYNRNVVTGIFREGSEPWDVIVEEHFTTAADLLNPARFFGDPWTMFYRMLEVYRDTRSFLDYPTIQTFLAIEYHIRTENQFQANQPEA